jgi:hypothetical protein
VGRGLRLHPGKDKVTVLDFVANVERINFVRELGKHINKGLGQSLGTNEREIFTGNHEQLSQYIGLSNFVFEDNTIELLERYQQLKSTEYLTQAEVVAAYQKTPSIPKLAAHYGVTWNAIYKHLKKAGIDTTLHKARSLSNDDIVQKYQELGSQYATAKHFGIDVTTVRARLKRAGATIIATNQRIDASPELIAAFNRLGSVRKAAIELGINRHSARKQLINAGIDTSLKIVRGITKHQLDTAYALHANDVRALVTALGNSWVTTYKALDYFGYLSPEQRPITSAMAAAAYYKCGTSIKAGELLGTSGSYVSKLSKDAKYIKRYKEK